MKRLLSWWVDPTHIWPLVLTCLALLASVVVLELSL